MKANPLMLFRETVGVYSWRYSGNTRHRVGNYRWVVRRFVGRDSSVSIATRNGLDGPEIESH